MSVIASPLVLPEIQQAPEFHAQAVPDVTDLNLLSKTSAGCGWVAGAQVATAPSPIDQSLQYAVSVASGTVSINGSLVAVTAMPAASPLACLPPDTTDRRDVVLVGTNGIPYFKKGTPCQVKNWTVASAFLPPLKPLPDGSTVVLAEVYIPGNNPPPNIPINPGMIVDKRSPALSTPTAGGSTFYFDLYPGVDPTGATFSDAALTQLLHDINALDPVNKQNGAHVVFGRGTYKFSIPFPQDRFNLVEGQGGVFRDGQNTILLFHNCHGIIINNAATSADGGKGDGTIIRDLVVAQTNTSSGGPWHAYQMLARSYPERLFLYAFTGDGYYVYGDVNVNVQYNSNGWRILGGGVEGCAGIAMHAKGNDANAGVCTGLDVRHCGQALLDESFLGNDYNGFECASNTIGLVVTGNSNSTQFYHPYAEGGQPNTFSVGVGVHGGYLGDDPTYVPGTFMIGNRGIGNRVGTPLVLKPYLDVDASLTVHVPLGAMTTRATDGAMGAFGTTLTGTFSPALTLADVGRKITVEGAGPAGGTLTTTISAVDTSGATPKLTLTVQASTTVSGAVVQTTVATHAAVLIRNEAGTAIGAFNNNGWLGIGTSAPNAPGDFRRAISGDVLNVAGAALTAAGDSVAIAITSNNSSQGSARLKRYTAASAGILANALTLETSGLNANVAILPNGTGSAILGASGGGVGFFGNAGTAKPTVSGSKGGNAALGNLISALAAMNLFVDSTT